MLREERGLTQDKVEELSGISFRTISDAENGKKIMNPENLIKFCNAFDVSLDYLLTGKWTVRETELINMKISELSGKQYEALKNIIENFLSVCE